MTALIVLVVSHFFYRDLSSASTGGLIFLYLPMYLLPAGLGLWALLYWLGPAPGRGSRRKRGNWTTEPSFPAKPQRFVNPSIEGS